MSLTLAEKCCNCPEHRRPFINEDGWILTGLPDNSHTWEAWTESEWRSHCLMYATQALVPVPVRREIARRAVAGEDKQQLAREYGIAKRTVQRYAQVYGRAA